MCVWVRVVCERDGQLQLARWSRTLNLTKSLLRCSFAIFKQVSRTDFGNMRSPVSRLAWSSKIATTVSRAAGYAFIGSGLSSVATEHPLKKTHQGQGLTTVGK